MLKKIIITGSNGLLGQKLVKLFLTQKNYEIHALARDENRLKNKNGYTYYSIDITQQETLTNLIEKIQPDIIIHTAAMTNVDACEINRDDCDRINVDAVFTIADVCSRHNIRLIHLSTDFVFDGQKGSNYGEEDAPNPISHYGLSKLRSEKVILDSNIDYVILRTILVYGMVDHNDRSNVVLWVKNSLENKKKITVVTDQYRMPTYAEDLAESCLLAVENKINGIFNVSSNTLMSIYEIAIEVANTFDLDANYILPVKTSELNLAAKRPYETGFDLKKSIIELKLPSYSFSERLQVFKNQIANS